MPNPGVCPKCSAPMRTSEETAEYAYWTCTSGHNSLEVNIDIVDRWPGGVSAEVAARKPWPDGKWVHLFPRAEAEDN